MHPTPPLPWGKTPRGDTSTDTASPPGAVVITSAKHCRQYKEVYWVVTYRIRTTSEWADGRIVVSPREVVDWSRLVLAMARRGHIATALHGIGGRTTSAHLRAALAAIATSDEEGAR